MGEEGGYNSKYDGPTDVPYEQGLKEGRVAPHAYLGKRIPGSGVKCQSPKAGSGMCRKRGSGVEMRGGTNPAIGHIRAFFLSSSEEDGEPLEVLNRVRKTMTQDRALGPLSYRLWVMTDCSDPKELGQSLMKPIKTYPLSKI